MTSENVSQGDVRAEYYLGEYGFMVQPGQTEINENDEITVAKNVNFTFSPHLNTLFVKRKEKCPFTISVSAPAPAGSIVKVILFAKSAKSQKEKQKQKEQGSKSASVTRQPVMRCRHHSESEQDGHVSPLHVVRSENAFTVYDCCANTGELSLSFPFQGAPGSSSAENQMDIENLTFLCYSSCIKVENRENIFLKFSLEHSGIVLGFIVFGLHVCSTPGRDRQNHETGLPKKRKRDAQGGSSEDKCMFEMKVRDRYLFEWLRKLNRGLELQEAIPLHIQEKYLKSYHKKFDQECSTSQSTSTSASNDGSTPKDVRVSLRRVLVRSLSKR